MNRPSTVPDVARVAAVLADPSRAAMMMAMIDGRAWTVTELARAAGISRPTATAHAHRLVESGLCGEVRQGRHRYLRLSSDDVADVLERLGALAGQPVAPRGLTAVTRDAALRRARTCYRHLAGELGVALCDELLRQGIVTPQWELGAGGREWFAAFGVDPTPTRQPPLRPCLDWTERREHLAGRLADDLCQTMLRRAWLDRRGDTRAVRLTPAGEQGLRGLGVELSLAS